ncbi:MAG: SURF1 family protein [Alphaproteobacteria bacterium]|nr:SURF1 family protein [Alphaproteobacteria bacterium]
MAEREIQWRRPTPAAWFCLGAGLVVLLGLAAWQFDRRAWKHDLIETIQERMSGPPVVLVRRIADPPALDYRRVRVTGRFAHDKEIYLYPRFHGGHPGLHVVTPLVRRGAPPVLVNRGWIPARNKDPRTRAAGQLPGVQTVTGVARTTFSAGRFQPRNDPAKGFWTGYDPEAMARAMGLAEALPVIVEAERGTDPRALPIGGVTRVNFRDNHLQYALTWLALAAALVAVFAIYHRPRPRVAS